MGCRWTFNPPQLAPSCHLTPDIFSVLFLRAFQVVPPGKVSGLHVDLALSNPPQLAPSCSFGKLLTLHSVVAVPFRLFSWRIQWAAGGLRLLQLLLSLVLIASWNLTLTLPGVVARLVALAYPVLLQNRLDTVQLFLLPGIQWAAGGLRLIQLLISNSLPLITVVFNSSGPVLQDRLDSV